MTTTIAKITKLVFDGVSAAFTGVIFSAVLYHDLNEGSFQEDYGSVTTSIASASQQEDYGSIATASTESEGYELLTSTTYGYDASIGAFSPVAETSITGGRAVVETAAVIKNRFLDYVSGPDDIVLALEGFTTTPKVGWRVAYNSQTKVIKAVGNIVGNSTFFEVVVA